MIRTLLPVLTLLLVSHGFAQAEEKFEKVEVRFEQNATDKDAEMLFEATSAGAGLATLKVLAPGGRTVIDFAAPDSKLGIRHITLESPEPKDPASVQADFPEGEYTFMGSTVTGAKLTGKATLSHKLPNTPSLVRPRPDEKGVPLKGLQIKWNSSAKNLAACVIAIEQEESGQKIQATLPASATTFAVPDGFLLPKTEYKLAIGTVSPQGGTSLIETSFTTEGKK